MLNRIILSIICLFCAVIGATHCGRANSTQELLDGNFLTNGLQKIDLLSPTQDQQISNPNPTLTWSSRGVSTYLVQIATDAAFSSYILEKEVQGTSYTVANSDLNSVSALGTSTYFWRVSIPKLSSNLQSKTGSFFLVAIPSSGTGYAGILYVDAASTNSNQSGSKAAPYKKIQAAISGADTARSSQTGVTFDIYVAQGTYSEQILLAPGISIRGGYENVSWTRNIAANTTTITAPNNIAIATGTPVSAGLTSSTIVEGFTISGGGLSSQNYGIWLLNSSPQIQNNTITGGSGTGGATNYGIYVGAGTPVISNNTIVGATSASNSTNYGIYIANATPTVSGNTVTGGNGGGTTTSAIGIFIKDSSPVISNNTVTGGNNNENTGVELRNVSAPTISRNTITGGNGAAGNTGLLIAYTTGSIAPVIINNTIAGGGGSSGYYKGIHISSASAPLIYNNTIYGGPSGVPAPTAIYMSAVSTPAIRNNILFNLTNAGAGNVGMCIWEITANSIPTAVENNNFFGCQTFYYEFSSPQFNYICATTGNLSANSGCLGTQLTSPTGSGNMNIDNAGNQLFVNFNGLDGLIYTQSDNNWHLKTGGTICNVRGGGLDLSATLTDDKDLITRTISSISGCTPANTGATNWSTGAFESN